MYHIQLNSRTQITVRNDWARDKWLSKYPAAKVTEIADGKSAKKNSGITERMRGLQPGGHLFEAMLDANSINSIRSIAHKLSTDGKKFQVLKERGRMMVKVKRIK